MDSSKDSSSMRNSVKLDGESEKNINFKSTPSQSGQSDNAENLFTSTSNPSSSFVPLNGPVANHMNSLPSNELGPRASRCSGNNPETNKNLDYQQCNKKVTNSNAERVDPAVAGSSRTVTTWYDNGTESNQDKQTCQRHKVCLDKGGSSSLPSTSGTSRTGENPETNSFRENRKRPSSLKLNRPNLGDDSSSDTGNDDYSLGSEDGCIYTYRGGEHLADLPSSFFSLDMGLPLDKHLPVPNYVGPQQGAAAGRELPPRPTSPEMDFLEMDFDPGPSCEADTGDESSPDAELEAANDMPEEIEPVLARGTTPEYVPPPVRYVPVIPSIPVVCPAATTSGSGAHGDADLYSYSVPSTSRGVSTGQGDAAEGSSSGAHNYVDQNFSYGPYITHVNSRGEQLVVRRTMSHGPIIYPGNLHFSSGELVSPSEILSYDDEHIEAFAHQVNQSTHDTVALSAAMFHTKMATKLVADKARLDAESQATAKASEAAASTSSSSAACVEPPRCMIWSESEACDRQVTQISTSACGVTAVVNVFNALGVPVNLEKISSSVGIRQRANNAPIPRYILSRAVAGCTAADLVSGIHRASDGLVTAQFFPTYPERAVSLSHWLADWITVGAVPILTLNLQAGYEHDIPDAWHHQMVFGVSPRGVYLCNPVECIREATLWHHLTSPSTLLIKAIDILTRFTADTDLTPLMAVPDRRFHTFNVLGQVINLIREWRFAGWGDFITRTRYIRIPASYQAGITVAALTGSEAHRRLNLAPQLPILTQTDPA